MPKKTSMRKKRGAGNAQDKHMAAKREMDLLKYQKNMNAIKKMKSEGKYLPPEYEGPQSYFAIDGIEIDPKTRQEMVRTGNTIYTDVTKMQRELFDNPMAYASMEEDGLTIGGRKSRRKRKSKKINKKTNKRSRRKNNRRKKIGGEEQYYVSKEDALKEAETDVYDEKKRQEYVKKCGTKNPFTGNWYWSKSAQCKAMVDQYWENIKARESMYDDAQLASNADSEEELGDL